ncbi:MAG: hypothetical protein JJV98_21155 [Desulfosarcina sp.]|nr:hypothetical protein [Desulfobacterales bacterium]
MDTKKTASKTIFTRSSVAPQGRFIAGIHRPVYRIANLRRSHHLSSLGQGPDGRSVTNHKNFSVGDIDVPSADPIYEIANPLPFRGVTYIAKDWADARAAQLHTIKLPARPPVSMNRWLRDQLGDQGAGHKRVADAFAELPEPVQLALATTSTDPDDLVLLAERAGNITHAPKNGRPTGLKYIRDDAGGIRPDICNHLLFEAVANNPFLPDDYKAAMVLRPGAQGDSEITDEWRSGNADSHVCVYLRRNSYIPWGHFAANMAEDAIRYDAASLSLDDVTGLRHLYYQRTFGRVARMLVLATGDDSLPLNPERLEALRRKIVAELGAEGRAETLHFNSTLWGWNFGFDYAPSRYRLHASHQQVHQQYALIPREVARHEADGQLPAYACGDLIDGFITAYRAEHGVDFFEAYLKAVRQNERLDGRADREKRLIVHADRHVMLFVPKAQTSQWELQLVTLDSVGNILEADQDTRQALDQAIYRT